MFFVWLFCVRTFTDQNEKLEGLHTMVFCQNSDGDAILVRDGELFRITFDDLFRFRFINPWVSKTSRLLQVFQRLTLWATFCMLKKGLK